VAYPPVFIHHLIEFGRKALLLPPSHFIASRLGRRGSWCRWAAFETIVCSGDCLSMLLCLSPQTYENVNVLTKTLTRWPSPHVWRRRHNSAKQANHYIDPELRIVNSRFRFKKKAWPLWRKQRGSMRKQREARACYDFAHFD